MSEKIACTACGALILASTAAGNGGQCTPCKRGFRKHIEDGKLRYIERKQAEANPDPATRHWRWLVREVSGSAGGFASLSPQNQMYFAAVLLEGEVYNGGFDQYFNNSAADYYAYAVRGLAEIGAAECGRILAVAKQLVFGPRDVPDRISRFRQLGKMTAAEDAKLDELGRRFVSEAVRIRDQVAQYAQKHGLHRA